MQLTDEHKEDAQNTTRNIAHRNRTRKTGPIADKLVDTAAAFNAALKTQENMVKFFNTSASKTYAN